MYAVVEYNDYRKEQSFEVIATTDDIEYAKKVAFQNAKKNLPKDRINSIYKITTKIENEYLEPINKIVVAYKIIEVEKYKKEFIIRTPYSSVYAVLKLKKQDIEIEEIDMSLICDNYVEEDDVDDDVEEEAEEDAEEAEEAEDAE